MEKAGALTHPTETLYPAGHTHIHMRSKILSRFLTLLGPDLRKGVSEIEGVPVRFKAELPDLR